MSAAQKHVLPVLAVLAVLALLFFIWGATGGGERGSSGLIRGTGGNVDGPGSGTGGDSPGTLRGDGGTDGPGSLVPGSPERLAVDRLSKMWTWNPDVAAEIVGLLKPDPIRKLTGIIGSKGPPLARAWAIQIAAALSADPNWDAAPNTPPPQPAPIADQKLREAIASVAAAASEDALVRRTAIAALPLELDGRPMNRVAMIFQEIISNERGGGPVTAAFDRLNDWFGASEAGRKALEEWGGEVEQHALERLEQEGIPEARLAAIRVLRWGKPGRVGPALVDALFSSNDVISTAAKKGLLDEAATRAKLNGEPATPQRLIALGLLTPEQVREELAPRTAMLSTLYQAAPGEAAKAWANSDLVPITDTEHGQVSRIVGQAVLTAPDDFHYAIVRTRLRERLTSAGSHEVIGLIASTSSMAAHGESYRQNVIEFLNELLGESNLDPEVTEALHRHVEAVRR